MKLRGLSIKRALWLGAVVLVAAGVAAPYLHADRFGRRVRESLEQTLRRKVEIGGVRFNLFRGPGFTLHQVVIHDDSSAGAEPFAYVTSIEARVRLLSLLRGRLEFASLRLESPSVNLVKTSGGWNFQALLSRAATAAPPAIVVSGGRLNFKLNGVKSAFFFKQADMELRPVGDPSGSFTFEYSGEPARSDRTSRSFGTLSGQGRWRPGAVNGRLTLDAELERSSLGELVALIRGYDAGVHGQVAGKASFSGDLSSLAITGSLQLSEIHRWDMLPPYAQGGRMEFRGRLDLPGQQLEIETVPAVDSTAIVRFRASKYLTSPMWGISVELNRYPLQPLVETVHHMGEQLPDSLTATGFVVGAVAYSPGEGLHGSLLLQEATLSAPNTPLVQFDEARIIMDGSRIRLAPTIVRSGTDGVRLEVDYSVSASQLDLRLSADSVRLATLKAEGSLAPEVPLPAIMSMVADGNWSGNLRYRRREKAAGAWSGAGQLEGALVNLQGFAEPLMLSRASVHVQGEQVSLTSFDGAFGSVEISGQYHFNPLHDRPNSVTCRVPKLQAGELERLLAPALSPPPGFLSRTLRLGRTPLPAWPKDRRVEGSLEIGSLSLAGETLESVSLRFYWDGNDLDVPRFQARARDGRATGYLRATFGGEQPIYYVAGSLEDADWKSGWLSGDGAIRTSGTGDALYWNMIAEGSFRARAVVLDQSAPARSMTGDWSLRWDRRHPRLNLKSLRLDEGEDVFTGEGATAEGGQLLVDLAAGERSLHLTGGMNPLRLKTAEGR
jgi:hypothetical protein